MKKIGILLIVLLIATIGVVVASNTKNEKSEIEIIQTNFESPAKSDLTSWD